MNRYGSDTGKYGEDMHGRMQIAKDELQNVLDSKHFYIVINDTIEYGANEIRRIVTDPTIPMHDSKAIATAELMLARLKEEI
jgi:guanylate kinase